MITVLAENLYKAAKEVKVTTSGQFPVLNYARLSAENGAVILTTAQLTNDGFKAKRATCSARVNEEFSTCFPMYNKVTWDERGQKRQVTTHPFLDWLRVMAEYKEVLTLALDPVCQIVTVTTRDGKSTTAWKCLDAQEFPPC
jgi:hypothetical protein